MSEVKTNIINLITLPNGDAIKVPGGVLVKQEMRLPVEYQEVKWIQAGFDGESPIFSQSKFIELSYVPTQDTRVYGKFKPIEQSGAATVGFYGARSSTGRFGYCNQSASNGKTGNPVIWWKDSLLKPVTDPIFFSTEKLFKIEQDKQFINVWIDGKKMLDNYDCGVATFNTGCNLTVGAANNSSSYFLYKKLNVYEVEVWDDQTLVHHLIPCYRIVDNVIGMYDLISDEFRESRSKPFSVCGPKVGA